MVTTEESNVPSAVGVVASLACLIALDVQKRGASSHLERVWVQPGHIPALEAAVPELVWPVVSGFSDSRVLSCRSLSSSVLLVDNHSQRKVLNKAYLPST